MPEGVFIFVDDDFARPIHADPSPDELDRDLWHQICETVNDAVEGDGEASGVKEHGDVVIAWRTLLKFGLSFVTVVPPGVRRRDVEGYLKDLSRRYLDEVDDVRRPERDGVADVVIDVIPNWDDEVD